MPSGRHTVESVGSRDFRGDPRTVTGPLTRSPPSSLLTVSRRSLTPEWVLRTDEESGFHEDE